MLTGRETELARLVGLVEELARGRGQALVVRGVAGIGKTALLEAARSAAREIGIQVLSVAGVETETDLAFSGLHDLLSPVIGERRVLPAPQSAALASALALEEVVPGDRLAVCVATLGLLEHAAARTPLLVIVDDLPWLDSASRECVTFAARRVSGSLAFLLAERDEDQTDLRTGVPELRGLPAATRSGSSAADSRGARPGRLGGVRRGRGGRRQPAGPSGAGRYPRSRPAVGCRPSCRFRLAPGLRLTALYQRRLCGLARDTRQALLIAAAYQGDDLRVIALGLLRAGQ